MQTPLAQVDDDMLLLKSHGVAQAPQFDASLERSMQKPLGLVIGPGLKMTPPLAGIEPTSNVQLVRPTAHRQAQLFGSRPSVSAPHSIVQSGAAVAAAVGTSTEVCVGAVDTTEVAASVALGTAVAVGVDPPDLSVAVQLPESPRSGPLAGPAMAEVQLEMS